MAKCPICNAPIAFMEGVRTSDGSICSQCARIVPSAKAVTTSEISDLWRKNNVRWKAFTETRVLHSPNCLYISIDDTHKYFTFGRVSKMNREAVVYSFDEVESYEYITLRVNL